VLRLLLLDLPPLPGIGLDKMKKLRVEMKKLRVEMKNVLVEMKEVRAELKKVLVVKVAQ
jgi:hypothetical protein